MSGAWPFFSLLLALVAIAGLALATFTLFGARELPRRGALALSALLAVSTVSLGIYVAGEDHYRRGGITRWEAYDARGLTVAAISVGLAAVVGLVVAGIQNRRALGSAAFLACGAAGVLQFLALFANSLN